jgi:hypothetical protein
MYTVPAPSETRQRVPTSAAAAGTASAAGTAADAGTAARIRTARARLRRRTDRGLDGVPAGGMGGGMGSGNHRLKGR